jgi:putative membrane-bound dehydrogenase-like protein
MRGHEKWEAYLRPILERLKEIDGRAPVSIMTNSIDPADPHLQQWLKEGLSLETHTADHPCPLLSKGDFRAAKSTYERCVDLMGRIPGSRPVAFRMPCCDSRNTPSPRFYAEIFNATTEGGNFLTIDSSVFNVLTPNDPALPRELVLDPDGRERFRKYLPFPSFVNTIDDYPYPYPIGRLCWQFPCVTPSDWSAQNLNKPNNPKTVEDLKAALDAVVIKQGVYNLVFHPHGWIRPDQVNEIIDHAVKKHGRKVKFLTFREAAARINKNLLTGQSLRSANGQDNGVRLIDLNADGYQDVVIGRAAHPDAPAGAHSVTRLWSPADRKWHEVDFPTSLVYHDAAGQSRSGGAALGIVAGHPTVLVNHRWIQAAHQFIDGRWIAAPSLLRGLHEANGDEIQTAGGSGEQGVRIRDIDGDGSCELIVGNPRQNAAFRWSAKSESWERLPFKLPERTNIVDDQGRDAGLRFVDVDEDGRLDVLFSNDDRYSLHLFESMEKGWSRVAVTGNRNEPPKTGRGIPPIVSAGMNAGAWVHSRHVWWQNESTDRLPDLVDRRSFNELLENDLPRAKSPEDALRSLRPRPGFQVEQVAAEPLVMDPIAFAWGFDGRLWVVEMADYPRGEDGRGKPGGRVRWLADTDGDGRYDRSTVFLEGLSSPTGVMPWRMGILVTTAPDLFYAEDRDGDGRADRRETVYTGFNEGNQQHRVNGLRFGLDNWVYVANGDSGGRIKSVKTGRSVDINGRDLRIRPDTGDLEAISGESQFGRDQDDWGNWFGNNNSNPLYHFALDERYLGRNPHVPTPDGIVHVPSVPGNSPVFPLSRTVLRFNDYHTANRITSAASAIIYRDELFGPQFAGNSFVSEPVHNLVHREVLARDGASFKSRRAIDEDRSEFLASSDNWFRPTTIRVGPDGALWVADMYRETIEHPEWIPDDWEKRLDLRAGHDRGRIYRVYPVGVKPRVVPRFDRLSAHELVALFESPGGTVRDMAQQRLMELQDRSVAEALEKMAQSGERPTARLHALCTLDGLGLLVAERISVIERRLADEHPAVRRHALRLSEPLLAASGSLLQAALKLKGDADPQVRQQLAYSLGECRTDEAARALAELLFENWDDRFIVAAAISSLRAENIAAVWEAFDARRSKLPPAALLEALISTTVGLDGQRGWLSIVDRIGKPMDDRYSPWQLAALADLVDALGRQDTALGELLSKAPDGSAQARQVRAMLSYARKIAIDSSAASDGRLAAIRLLAVVSDDRQADMDRLLGLLARNEPPAIQSAAAAMLLKLPSREVAERIFGAWADLSPSVRRQVLNQAVARRNWITAALDALEAGNIAGSDFDVSHRAQLREHGGEVGRRAEQLLGAAIDSNRAKVVEQFTRLELVGDARRGLAVFEKRCASCHRWGDRGHQIGPDLASIKERSKDAMLVAILDPNRAVESKFVSYTAVTGQGLSYTGLLATESDTSVTLVTQDGKQQALLRSEIEELTTSGKSLMPEGFENELSKQELADVLKMLAGAPETP